MENKSLWKIYKERYLNRKTSIKDIEKFLREDYGVELRHISIDKPVEPKLLRGSWGAATSYLWCNKDWRKRNC